MRSFCSVNPSTIVIQRSSQRRNFAADTFVTFVLVAGSGWELCAAAVQLA